MDVYNDESIGNNNSFLNSGPMELFLEDEIVNNEDDDDDKRTIR